MLPFRVYAEYLQDQLHRLAAHSRDLHSEARFIGQATTLWPGQVIPLLKGRFGKRLGDTFVKFTCKPVLVELREAEGCYLQEVPVVHDSTPFMDLVTRVLQAGGTQSLCLNDFPLQVQGRTGWWRLLQRIKSDLPPRARSVVEEPEHHQFDRDAGLYSEDELRQWQHLQSVPTMQRLLTADLTQGVCGDINSCSLMPVPGAPRYTLANLEHSVLGAFTPSWFEDLREVGYYGGLTSGWLIIAVILGIMWHCKNRHCRPKKLPTPATNMFTSIPSPNPVYLSPAYPTIVEAAFPSAPLALEDHRVSETAIAEPSALTKGGCGTERGSLRLCEPRPLVLSRKATKRSQSHGRERERKLI